MKRLFHYWSWNEFGFCFKILRVKQENIYWYQVDIHLLFYNLQFDFYSKI